MNDLYMLIATQLTRAIMPVIIIVGIVSNSLNIAVLTRPSLYNHACSRYFLAVAANYIFSSITASLNNLLVYGHQVDVRETSNFLCKLISYITHVTVAIWPHLIILALIDRYCASSIHAQRRKFSNVRVARWTIMLFVTVFALYFINTAILVEFKKDGLGCNIRGDTIYKQVYIFTQAILFAVIAPVLMAVFGGMTIYNATRVNVVPTMTRRYRRTENQLIQMLLFQVGSHIVLTLPACIFYIIGIVPNTFKYTLDFAFLYQITQILLHASINTGFVLYFLSSSIYRQECKRLVYKILRIHRENQVQPEASLNTALPMATLTSTRTAAHNSTKCGGEVVKQ